MTTSVITVNPNAPDNEKLGNILCDQVIEKWGIADGVAILLRALYRSMLLLMHLPTPMAEGTITGVATLLNDVRDKVLEHADCCRELEVPGAASPTETIH